ncbi:MAG: glycine cleavage system aminomethyltransferase GcvT [Acidobacteria bacterium]|nr:glycine cleavage system aminomethyltransferase GcvT [Acidobacteriota bacterium]
MAELGARFVEFAGWEMPVQFSGPIEEHMAVRQAVGLFDVSHMARFELRGPSALAVIQELTCNDASRLVDNQVQYSALMTHQGTVVDDITVYRISEEHYFLCVNAANAGKDHQLIQLSVPGREAELSDVSGFYAQIALQGPAAEPLLQSLTKIDLESVKFYRFAIGEVDGARSIVSRTGYTGEDGFEVYAPSEDAPRLWRKFMEQGRSFGIRPCGLAARNTLRLEAKMLLYGNDMDETTTLLEADLAWILKMDKGEFLGREALRRQQQEGLKRKLAGFEVLDRAPARDHYPIHFNGQPISQVCSGSFAPYLRKNIGLAYLPIEACQPGTRFEIAIRGRQVPAQVVPTPFYRRQKKQQT